ncbi:MAG: hypothetical protein M1838_001026 [Thelocarpon superellum]|nr:MAG: hypothetical protein M1838_001026 [Thelocarpon superellum]
MASIIPFARVLSSVPAQSKAVLIFNDKASDDFNITSATITQNWETLTRNGEIEIFPIMSPLSFYRQVLPDASVDVAFCLSSLTHLERGTPAAPRSTSQKPEEVGPAQRAVLASMARSDLLKFLTHRAREIRPGGLLVTCLGSTPASGGSGMPGLIGAMIAGLTALVMAGRVSPAVAGSLKPPSYERTMLEIQEALEVVKDEWTVNACDEKLIQHPAYHALEAAKAKPDVRPEQEEALSRAYASAVVEWIVAATAGYVIKALRGGQTLGWARFEESADEAALLAEFVQKTKEAFLRESRDSPVGVYHVFLKLTRK